MVRPRPSPPRACAAVGSAWRKRSNTWGRKSGGIPMPLSATRISVHRSSALHGNPDVALLGRELHSVGQQVHHHLLQAARVAQDRTGRQVEHLVDPYALFLRSRPDALGSRIDEVARLDGLDVQAYLARSHAAHVHQILDQLGLQVHALFDHVQAPVELLFAAAPAQHMCPSEDGAQWGAQFVRNDGQELVPQGAGPLGVGPCSLTLAQRLARRGEFLFEVRAHSGLRRHILANQGTHDAVAHVIMAQSRRGSGEENGVGPQGVCS